MQNLCLCLTKIPDGQCALPTVQRSFLAPCVSLAPEGDGGNVEGDVQVGGRNGGYVKGPSLKLKANATMPSQNGVLVHALKEQGDVYRMDRLAERHVGYWWPSEGVTRQMILTELLIEAILSQQHALAV